MELQTELYRTQQAIWPETGRVILAQYDADSVVVYQAYRPQIGHFAANHDYFGGEFKLSRMSWIKPNFLWMMYRSGWASKEGQEVVLAVRIKRTAFDKILAQAVNSSFKPELFESRCEWESEVEKSDVRIQWDPDHAPSGAKEERRAIQLGLRGEVLYKYSREWIVDITDVSDFVREQSSNVSSNLDELITPRERPYPVSDPKTIRRLRLTVTG